MKYEELSRSALIRLLRERDAGRAGAGRDGSVLDCTGRAAPWQIVRQVRPKTWAIDKRASVGGEETANEVWDGENLSAMVTLYRYRGQVDLVLTDPPYNTGEDFRYNDKWDKDPGDPDLGDLVAGDDGSRHGKWLRFMTPRLWMMREMLKPGGVIAICIDHRELYRLGMLMDEIFHEENRLAILNWQKSAAARPDNRHVSTSTEYVLVYGKDIGQARTASLARGDGDNRRYSNPDRDPGGSWREGNLTAKTWCARDDYGIQSPFTGEVHYPAGNGAWRHPKRNIRRWLEGWGSDYEERDLGDGRGKALMVAGQPPGTVSPSAARKAAARLEKDHWPFVWFGRDGAGRPRVKTYLERIRKGKVPVTYWADEDFSSGAAADAGLGAVSWDYAESGRSADGVAELTAVVGPGHGFTTVKPMKLFGKIIELWCRGDGIVLDPFAGSGTTGHAVLDLNKRTGARRRFILVEQGNGEKGDRYARSLTADRLRRAINGRWKSGDREPLGGGFRFCTLERGKVDADAVGALAREEMIDLLLAGQRDGNGQADSRLRRLPAGGHRHLFAVNGRNEGCFLVWTAPDGPSTLSRAVFREIVREAGANGLAGRYHVYASRASCTGSDIEFHRIPDQVLAHVGSDAQARATKRGAPRSRPRLHGRQGGRGAFEGMTCS